MVTHSRVDWHVVPARTPQLLRRCRNCERAVPFASTDKFRVNANKRKIDVWLLYRCTECDTGWKRPVHERASVSSIAADLLERYHHNDLDTAQRWAYDARGFAVAGAVPFRVVGAPPAEPCIARVCFERPFDLRWDRLLAQALAVSRSGLARLVASDQLSVPASARGLNARVRDGDLVRCG